MAKKFLQNISVPHSMSLIYNIKEIQKKQKADISIILYRLSIKIFLITNLTLFHPDYQ